MLKDQIQLQKTGSHTYTSSWHRDWTAGPSTFSIVQQRLQELTSVCVVALHGGHIAAVIQLAAQTHFTTTLAEQNQPDILALHFDFLLACVPQAMTITVVDLKVGKGTSTIQQQLTQKDRLNVNAIATSTKFDQSVGATAKTDWAFHPPPRAAPNFERVLANKPDDNWLPWILTGEILPFTRRQLYLHPRGGFDTAGIFDGWSTFPDEPLDATHLTLMTDCVPAMSDTLLNNKGMYDAHTHYQAIEAWSEKDPGVPAPLTNSLKDAVGASTFNITLTLDIEFKRRLPQGGQEWMFTRAATKLMQDERLDLEVTLCDHDMEILCLAHQTILALNATRKSGPGKKAKAKAFL